MFSKEELEVKSRQQLYSIINQLNISVEKLRSEKQLLKIILNNFEKFYKYFDKISDKYLSDQVLNARNEIIQWIDLSRFESKVSVIKLDLFECQLKSK